MKLLLIFLLFTAESNVLAEELKIPPAEIVYACSGGTALFPWNSNNKTELTTDVKWFHHMNNGLHKMVALFTNRMFMSTEGRLSHLADNRLSLRDVTVNDTGLYHVDVKYTDNTRFNFTFYLQVSDSPMVRDQQLQVTQDSVALWNKTSSQWTIRLLCGTFTFIGNDAPIQVEWILPDGRMRVSNDYEKGQFYLTLSAPMKDDMKYTCRIPKQYYPNICLTKKTKTFALTEASLFVEEGKTKLIMIETEQERMKDTIANLISALAAKEQKFSISDEHLKNAIDNLNSIVVAKEEQFRTSDERLKNAIDNLNSIVVGKEKDLRTSDERLKNAVDNLNSSVIAKEQQLRTSDERLKNAVEKLQSFFFDNQQDVCWGTRYRTIYDDAGVRDQNSSTEGNLCDINMPNGWYRWFLNGQDAVIPTSCTPERKCGTHATIWIDLNGQPLPTVGRDVEGRACGNWKGCCAYRLSAVTVRNCGSYYIYHLRSLHGHTFYCSGAYCLQRKT